MLVSLRSGAGPTPHSLCFWRSSMLKDSMLKCRHGVSVPQGAGKTFQSHRKKKMKTLFLCQHTNPLHSWCPSVRDATCWSSRKGTLGPGHVKVAVKQHAAKEHPPNCPPQGPRSHAELDTHTVFGPSRCLGWLWGEHEMAVSCMDPTSNTLPSM